MSPARRPSRRPAGRLALAAVVMWVLSVLLWWLSRDVVAVLPPTLDPPVEGLVERTATEPGLLLLATIAAGVAMVLTTLSIYRAPPPPEG